MFAKKAENWRRAIEDRGLQISRTKTEYMKFCDDRDSRYGYSERY